MIDVRLIEFPLYLEAVSVHVPLQGRIRYSLSSWFVVESLFLCLVDGGNLCLTHYHLLFKVLLHLPELYVGHPHLILLDFG